MKIYNPIGSKARLVEIFQKVNNVNVKLNEDFNPVTNDAIVTTIISGIENGSVNIKSSKTQVVGEDTFIELLCGDAKNGVAKLVLKIVSQEGDQEGVETINSVELKEFTYRSADGSQSYELNEDDLKDFNNRNGDALYGIAQDYVDFESDTTDNDLGSDELAEAINLIDAIRTEYNGGTERMQTNKAYADEKPNNSAVRVSSPELNKFVNEEGVKLDTRAFNTQLSDGFKKRLIRKAIEMVTDYVDKTGKYLDEKQFAQLVKIQAMKIYELGLASTNMNEGEEGGDYPDPIGKKFKPKKVYPKKKKKTVTTVNLGEADEYVDDEEEETISTNPEETSDDGMSLEPQGDEIEQLAQDKEETGEVIPGGKGENKSPLEFDADQVIKGLEVEKEHTDDPMYAIEIVLDHLSEDPEYYTVKDNPEASAQQNAATDASGEESGDYDSTNPDKEMGSPMEHARKMGWSDDTNKNSDDKETTDALLGYKPKNVGDTDDEE